MKKPDLASRNIMATRTGVRKWALDCRLTDVGAAGVLGIPLRTYTRYKAEGLPNKLQRETILDRMEAALPKSRRG